MAFSDFFRFLSRKPTPLTDDIRLGDYFDPFYHRGDYYDAATHTVRKFVCIPGGPQGFRSIRLPPEIKTLEQLLPWLAKNHDFHLKEKPGFFPGNR